MQSRLENTNSPSGLEYAIGQILNHTSHKYIDIKPPVTAPPKCERPDSGAKTDPDKDLKTKDCDLGGL